MGSIILRRPHPGSSKQKLKREQKHPTNKEHIPYGLFLIYVLTYTAHMDINYYFEKHPKITTLGIITIVLVIIIGVTLWVVQQRGTTTTTDNLDNYSVTGMSVPVSNTDLPVFFQKNLPEYYRLKNSISTDNLSTSQEIASQIKRQIDAQLQISTDPVSQRILVSLSSSLQRVVDASDIRKAAAELTTLRLMETTVLSDLAQ